MDVHHQNSIELVKSLADIIHPRFLQRPVFTVCLTGKVSMLEIFDETLGSTIDYESGLRQVLQILDHIDRKDDWFKRVAGIQLELAECGPMLIWFNWQTATTTNVFRINIDKFDSIQNGTRTISKRPKSLRGAYAFGLMSVVCIVFCAFINTQL